MFQQIILRILNDTKNLRVPVLQMPNSQPPVAVGDDCQHVAAGQYGHQRRSGL
jgi:hypothetical protein